MDPETESNGPLVRPSFVEPERPEEPTIPWPGPTPEMLKMPEFEAVWQCIKKWDISVPNAYVGYCGATGNHVRAILDALGITTPVDGNLS